MGWASSREASGGELDLGLRARPCLARDALAAINHSDAPLLALPQYKTGRTLGSGTYAVVKEAVHIGTGKVSLDRARRQPRRRMLTD